MQVKQPAPPPLQPARKYNTSSSPRTYTKHPRTPLPPPPLAKPAPPPPPPPPPMEPCPESSCSMEFEAHLLPLHQVQVHAPKTTCTSCTTPTPIPSPLLTLHMNVFHPPEREEGEEAELGDTCQLCDLKLETSDLARHLLEEHEVRVVEEEEKEESKPAITFACHHCQRLYSTDKKLEKHVDRVHLKGDGCKVTFYLFFCLIFTKLIN